MRMIGLDVGERRIGIAFSDGRVAVPLIILEHEGRASDLERVASLAAERQADAVVIGLPLASQGEEGPQARKTRRFGDALARRLAVPVVYQDERLSTHDVRGAAGGRVQGAGARAGKARVDDLAATVILQAYLDREVSA